MQPVLFKGEEEAARKAGLSDSLSKEDRDKAIDMFKIEDDEEGEDDADDRSKRQVDGAPLGKEELNQEDSSVPAGAKDDEDDESESSEEDEDQDDESSSSDEQEDEKAEMGDQDLIQPQKRSKEAKYQNSSNLMEKDVEPAIEEENIVFESSTQSTNPENLSEIPT